jgi:hypothetical protein
MLLDWLVGAGDDNLLDAVCRLHLLPVILAGGQIRPGYSTPVEAGCRGPVEAQDSDALDGQPLDGSISWSKSPRVPG